MTLKKITTKWPLFLMLGLVLTFNSCKKAPTTTAADDGVSTSDQNSVSNGTAAIADDAAVAADGNLTRSTQGNPWLTVCGGVATFDSAGQTITIVYGGSTVCNGVKRSGTVTVTLTGDHWGTQGSYITVSSSGLVLTDAISNLSYTLSGSFTVTNESGNLLTDLLTNQSLTVIRRHQTAANSSMQLTFPNGSKRTWTFDRTRAWSVASVNSQTVLNASLYTENADTIEATGTDRYGQTFTDKINSPIQANSYACTPGISLWLPYTGEFSHHIDNRTATITAGTNSSGQSVGTSSYCTTGAGTYGYYLTYVNTRTNVNASLFIPY